MRGMRGRIDDKSPRIDGMDGRIDGMRLGIDEMARAPVAAGPLGCNATLSGPAECEVQCNAK